MKIKKVLLCSVVLLLTLLISGFASKHPTLYQVDISGDDVKATKAVMSFDDNKLQCYYLSDDDKEDENFYDQSTLYVYDKEKNELLFSGYDSGNTVKIDDDESSKDRFILEVSDGDDEIKLECKVLPKDESEKFWDTYNKEYINECSDHINRYYTMNEENEEDDDSDTPHFNIGIVPDMTDIISGDSGNLRETLSNGEQEITLLNASGEKVVNKMVEVKRIPEQDFTDFNNPSDIYDHINDYLYEENSAIESCEEDDDYVTYYMSLWYHPTKQEFIGFIAAESDYSDDDNYLWGARMTNIRINDSNDVLLNSPITHLSKIDNDEDDTFNLVNDYDDAKEKLEMHGYEEIEHDND